MQLSMKVMGFLTAVKVSILLLVVGVGLLAAIGVLPTDVDAASNLSFEGTANTIAPYASGLYYVSYGTVAFADSTNLFSLPWQVMNGYSGWHNLNYVLDEVKVREKEKSVVIGQVL